jgi:hypothetical protein
MNYELNPMVRKIENSQIFFGFIWLTTKAILLDTQIRDESHQFAQAIYCGRSRIASGI